MISDWLDLNAIVVCNKFCPVPYPGQAAPTSPYPVSRKVGAAHAAVGRCVAEKKSRKTRKHFWPGNFRSPCAKRKDGTPVDNADAANAGGARCPAGRPHCLCFPHFAEWPRPHASYDPRASFGRAHRPRRLSGADVGIFPGPRLSSLGDPLQPAFIRKIEERPDGRRQAKRHMRPPLAPCQRRKGRRAAAAASCFTI
jgi:hypothetical protein